MPFLCVPDYSCISQHTALVLVFCFVLHVVLYSWDTRWVLMASWGQTSCQCAARRAYGVLRSPMHLRVAVACPCRDLCQAIYRSANSCLKGHTGKV